MEYSVTAPVPVDVAFRAFQNFDRLLHRGIYEEVVWVEGEPWKVGSRLRYEVTRPVRASIAAVVTAFSPPRSIDLLNHALGVTAEQHVSFGPDLRGGTRIRATTTLVGKSSELSEVQLQEATAFLIRDALDTLVALCQKQTGSAPDR